MPKETTLPRGGRPDPEALLRQVQAEEHASQRGRLKIFLGYSSGVGKSFRMLDEARRRKERGQDVVVGAVQPGLGQDAEAILKRLEVVPLRTVDGVPLVDVEIILSRHPEVCIIDGLAYNNPSASRHPKRWQDVEELLGAGISVITSLNLQYVGEQQAQVEMITGKRAAHSVPESFIKSADEIVIVDAPAEVCERGALSQAQLSELREMALVLAADVVDQQLGTYRGAHERILVCITPRTSLTRMLDSACTTAHRFHGELYAVSVTQPEITPQDHETLERNLAMAREAGAKVEMLDGEDPVMAILEFAKKAGITQIFIGHTQRHGWLHKLASTPVDRLLAKADGFDVRVFPQ
jgi:two-component system sensor histidine kinase KdpD